MNSELFLSLNDLEINSEATGLYLDGDLTGLGFPDIRTSSGLNSGEDGGYIGIQHLGMRAISIEGRAYAPSVTQALARKRQLQATLAKMLAPNVGTLKIRTYDGNSYLIYVHPLDIKMPIADSQNFHPFKIDLLAPDSIIYDDTSGTELVANLSRAVSGGFTWPITWPITWAASSGPTTVTNSGTVFIKPTIRLRNIMTNPLLTNVTTGRAIRLEGLTTAQGDLVVLDMRRRTITLNGGSIFEKIGAGSDFWGLVTGPNNIMLESSGGSDNVSGTVHWRNGVLGI